MKLIFLGVIMVFTMHVQAQRRLYKVGDSLACGTVFHVETDSLSRQRLLICSLQDQSAGMAWYNNQFVTTRATRDVMFGRANAEKVIGVQGNGNYAAALCRNFSLKDSSCLIRDTLWYLPSVVELKRMYQVLDSTGRLSFAKEGYWSSVEFSDQGSKRRKSEKKAMIVDFLNGRSFPVIKSNLYHVRAIREATN